MIEILACAIKNLSRKRFRTFLTIAGIAIGVASVVLISTIGDVGKKVINDELDSLGIGSIMIKTEKNAKSTVLGADDLSQIQSVEGVEDAIPIMMDVSRLEAKNTQTDCVVWGIDAGAKQVLSLQALHGRLIAKSDVASHASVCLVDEDFAKATYGRSNIVGKTLPITLGGTTIDCSVIGVVKSGASILQNLISDYVPSFVYLPYSTIQQFSGKTSFDQIAVKLAAGYDEDEMGHQLVQTLELKKGQPDSLVSDNIAKQKEQLNSILNTVALVLAAIAAISLLVAGLGIMTVMLVSVSERTREIGIKKSIGSKRYMIMLEFMGEALAISVIGSLAGSVIGSLIAGAGCLLFGLPVLLNPWLILFCIGFAVATGLVFGVYPALQAARLKPVDALRYE